jgi:hypothetical protein
MRHPATGAIWTQFADTMWDYPGPVTSWLSPLNRAQALFPTTDRPLGQGPNFLVPEEAVRDSEISLVAAVKSGKAVLSFELKDLNLRQFEFETKRR